MKNMTTRGVFAKRIVSIGLISTALAIAAMSSAWAAQPTTKQQMYSSMMSLAQQMDSLRPRIAADTRAAATYMVLQSQYEVLSASLGGDRPWPSADSDPAGAALDHDVQNLLGNVPPAPPHCSATTASFANETPVPIPDVSTATSTIVVAGAANFIADVNLTTFITHTFCADLDVTITSPAGTIVTLTTDNGLSFDNVFNGTQWDDDANPGGQVPIGFNNGLASDSFYDNLVTETPLVPEEALGAFIGENPNGTWTLKVSDDFAADVGSIDAWSLEITTLDAAPINTTAPDFTNSTPVVIPSVGASLISSTLAVDGLPSYLCDVDLTTFITHTWCEDLDITLTSPAGTVVTISTDNGISFDNVFNGTVWDDNADPGGQVPYSFNTGIVTDTFWTNGVAEPALVPEEAMAAFVGEDPNGTWTLRIRDDTNTQGGSLDSWTLHFTTCRCNQPPDCPEGESIALWPPNHAYHEIDLNELGGVIDPDGDEVTYEITSITQDEPVNGPGDGNTSCDGTGVGTDVAQVRAERKGGGNGRVYHINYTASDGVGGECEGTFIVRVPHNQGGTAIDDGQDYDSTECFAIADLDADRMVGTIDRSMVVSSMGLFGPDEFLNMLDADVNMDGTVDIVDLQIVMASWGLTQ